GQLLFNGNNVTVSAAQAIHFSGCKFPWTSVTYQYNRIVSTSGGGGQYSGIMYDTVTQVSNATILYQSNIITVTSGTWAYGIWLYDRSNFIDCNVSFVDNAITAVSSNSHTLQWWHESYENAGNSAYMMRTRFDVPKQRQLVGGLRLNTIESS